LHVHRLRIDYHYFALCVAVVRIRHLFAAGHPSSATRLQVAALVRRRAYPGQPSEFAKLAAVLALATYFSNHGGDARDRHLALC
jgi:hypothetical protein